MPNGLIEVAGRTRLLGSYCEGFSTRLSYVSKGWHRRAELNEFAVGREVTPVLHDNRNLEGVRPALRAPLSASDGDTRATRRILPS